MHRRSDRAVFRDVLPRLAAVVAAGCLAACGGGGSDAPATASTPTAVDPPVVVSTVAPPVVAPVAPVTAPVTPPVATIVCSTTALPSGAADTTLTMAAYPTRDYTLVLPSSYVCGQALAVIVVLHGGGGNKENMRRTACPNGDLTSAGCIDRIANAAGMAVVFPNGTLIPGTSSASSDGQRTWNAGGGQNGYICVSGNACNNNVDDIAYMRALVADVGTHITVDPKRVFASGFSDGAAMTQRIGCQAADVFAAIATVSGENQFATAGCTPAQPIAVLDIHGTADACWPYAGGAGGCVESGLFVSVADTLAGWASRNGCGATAALTTLPPLPGVNDGTSVVRHSYSGCVAGGDLEHLEVVGNGHFWPQGYSYSTPATAGGVMSEQLNTSQTIVDFFVVHGRS